MAFFMQDDDFSAELEAINRVCEENRHAREQHDLAVAMAASIECDLHNKAVSARQLIAEERVHKIAMANAWAEQEKLRIRQERVYFDTILEPARLAEQKMKFDALEPEASEAKVQCPWCSKTWLLEVNCGIVHCGVKRVGRGIQQLPPHARANAFIDQTIVSGCGRQFKYDRVTKGVSKCAGL